MWSDCGRVIVTMVILAQWIISGLGVVLTPCRVENILTQPQYATSLASKALVQIIQIPPVFTQNVMVGKCMNKDLELSDRPGDYFICRQRYSSVEVYITELTDLLHIESNSTNETGKSLGNIFRSTNFIRESVVVESGCDFTFNLLPLLMRQQEVSQGTATRKDDLRNQNYRLLKSPYHKNHPNANPPPNSKGPIASSFQPGNLQQGPPSPISPQPQHQHQQGGNQYSSSGGESSPSHQGPHLYSPSPLGNPALPPLSQSGGGVPFSQIATPTYSQSPVYGEQQQQQQRPAEGVYQLPPRPSSMAIRERAEQDESSSYHTHHNNNQNPHYPSAIEDGNNELHSYESSSEAYGKYNASAGGGGGGRRGEYYETTELNGDERGGEETPYGGGGGAGGGGAGAAHPQETGGRGVGEELYPASHKVGMPLLILDKEYDPLLKSIRGASYSDNSFVS